MSILEVKGLSRYFGGLAALSNLNLTIQEGEIRGIIGPNGAGKTTLFNVISGVYRPTSGQIFYMNGKRIDGLSSSKIAEMGLVRTFQRTALYHDFTVIRNVTVARYLHAKENIFGVFAGTVKKMEEENVKKEFSNLGKKYVVNLTPKQAELLNLKDYNKRMVEMQELYSVYSFL